ncbi:sugar ABC transporter substrate-binding protein [Streptomyces sp. AV19]|uniref:sugar ABC transporter substrate-binding protein n=1 Tax=Streptomyces sp. AV19 TaxID=2793068 RepID=UPI0018FEBE5D|nr:sugar ABC transporter substrate-binding protein [Streptomyces sp. AV19]MBH1937993.1 sugar ABC transporter substrate-binding protein [Streptomyces sp. AV19]MDG4536609.1 sugar ABC transporter substrate-binding protein [Streptomyces sp. AV19]
MKPIGVRAAAAVAAVVMTAGLATACNRGSDEGDGKAGAPIGVDLPRADSDFWNSYAKYIARRDPSAEVRLLPVSNSRNDIDRLVANALVFANTGAKAVVMAPQDTGAVSGALKRLEEKRIPVISVDTRPDAKAGRVYMVVRADNRAYGTKACEFLGGRLGGRGKVAELQGDLKSINGRDRSEAFADCMRKRFPGITVFPLPTDWKGDVASNKLQTLLTRHPDINGLYLQAGGVFLDPTLTLLRQKGLLRPAGRPGHISIVSNDGIPQELDAIRRKEIDATVSQPADLYAKYALYYARAAAAGKEFRPGRTDHGSTVVGLPNGLEDQLPAPLVTAENVDDPSLWANGAK